MDGDDFRTQMMYWYGGLVALTLGFPFFLQAIIAATGCASTGGGACGAIAVVVGMYAKPPLVYAIVIGLGVATIRRISSLGLGYGWWVATICWLLVSSGFFISLGNFWGANFAMGLIGMVQPLTLFLAAFSVFLSFDLESSGWRDDQTTKLCWIAAAGSTIHAALQLSLFILLGIPLIGTYIFMTPGVIPFLAVVSKASSLGLGGAWWLPWLDFLVFASALTLLAVRHSWPGEEPQSVQVAGADVARYRNTPTLDARAPTFGKRR